MDLFINLKSTSCFTNLSAYNIIFPTIIDCLKAVKDCNCEDSDLKKIIIDVKTNCVNVLNYLAIGYNNYNPKDKVYYYNLSRDSVSTIQSLLVLLFSADVFSLDKSTYLIKKLQDDLRLFNGTIRKIENKDKDGL